MPLIPPESKKLEKVQLRFRVSQDLLEQITAYCEWAGIKKRDHLFEHAVLYVLQHDAEWQEHLKTLYECDTE